MMTLATKLNYNFLTQSNKLVLVPEEFRARPMTSMNDSSACQDQKEVFLLGREN
jgi:hypothetical protein